ncbi:hypothetical protein [Streptomyces poonensis]|uniref:Uncharacterized protein n=1 Tax=Streptomyces poonensis TaxID=68255 RepID=A0A918PI54_9ACTN|nr:hypothetical protein [Streptomyces poonensis]GGZ11123.1 hypothetical protein GCM10010365_33240 [Streptomyces poonensis]GLJ91618.1 hypothetical protein GCM10017589_42250 [Streptomyces poonensis]
MGVIDSQWWGLWWPWLVVWALTAGCLAVVLRYVVARLGRLRRGRGGRARTMGYGMCFFLHRERVMNLYQFGGFSAALEQEVAEETNVTTKNTLSPKSFLGGVEAGREASRQRVTEYVQTSTPITVIRLLMDTMRKEDVIVDVDLASGLLIPNRALGENLRDRGDAHRAPVSAAAAVSAFVLVNGRFSAQKLDNDDIVLCARYGRGEPPAQVRIPCEADGLLEGQNPDYLNGEFQARCLARVHTWNRETGELTLNPVAVFR